MTAAERAEGDAKDSLRNNFPVSPPPPERESGEGGQWGEATKGSPGGYFTDPKEELREQLREFHGDGFFQWQFSDRSYKERWSDYCYDEEKYWGGFSREPFDPHTYTLPDWAIGPFEKYVGNPVLSPDPNGWDCGHFGGVHNGSVLEQDGRLYYILPRRVPPARGTALRLAKRDRVRLSLRHRRRQRILHLPGHSADA